MTFSDAGFLGILRVKSVEIKTTLLLRATIPSRARETEESKSVQHIFAPKTEIAEPIFGNFRNGRLFPFGIIFQFQNTGC